MLKPVPFGKYYLLERINVGGMAEVFKAKAYGVEGFERLFAVKKILPQIAADEEFIRMFIDEAKIAVQLNHANIAQIFDLGKVDGAYFIALEYVSGKDLRTIFEQARKLTRPWSIKQACYVVMQVCEGMDYAHNKRDPQGLALNLVHRDISPQNVLISYEGEVKIIDFGIAKAAGRASRTQAGILKGKFGYMSPEQVRGLPLDRRSDIFSLGIILYELLTNERLFYAESDFSILEKIRNVEITPPSTINPEITPELEQIVMRALHRSTEERFQSAAEFHDELQRYMFASGLFYTRKDLAGYLHEMFADEIEREQAKLEEYRRVSPPPGSASSRPDLRTLTPALQLHPLAAPQDHPGAAVWSSIPASEPGPNGSSASTSSHILSWLGPLPGGLVGPPGPLPPGLPGNGGPIISSVVLRQDGLAAGSEEDAGGRQLTPSQQRSSSPGAKGNGVQAGLQWDDEEAETTVYDRPPRSGSPLDIGEVSEADIVYAEPRPERSLPRSPAAASLAPHAALPDGGAAARPRWRLGFLFVFTLAALLGAITVAYVALTLRGRDTSIHLTTVPADGIEVLLDDRPIHRGPTPIRIQQLTPGTHQLLVRRAGFEQELRQIELAQDEESVLVVTLRPAGPAPGALRLVSNPPGAFVELDGKPSKDRTPLLLEELAPGPHRIVLTMPGHEPWSTEVKVQSGATVQRTATLKPATVDLALDSEPRGARYTIKVLPDGERRSGETPVRVSALPAGVEVEVTVEQRGYSRWSKIQRLEAGGSGVVTMLAELTRTVESSWGRPAAMGKGPEPAERKAAAASARPGASAQPSALSTPGGPPAAPPAASAQAAAAQPAPPPQAAPPPPPPLPVAAQPPGTLKLMVVPYARVCVDGTDIGESPIMGYKLAPGMHRVTLINNEALCRQDFQVEIQPGAVSFVKKVDPPWCNRAAR